MAISPSIDAAGFSVLALQYRARLMNARAEAGEQAATRSDFRPPAEAANRAARDWAELRPGINAAAAGLETMAGRVKAIRDTVSSLLKIKNSAAAAGGEELQAYVRSFNAAVGKLNGLANATSQVPNLVGSSYDVDIAYFSNTDLDVAAVSHRNLSSDYTITETGGNYWKKDDTTTDVTLLQYDSAGVATGKSAVINQELRLDSLSGSTIGFTIHAGTASEESFSGAALSRTGLGILDGWAYGGLAGGDGLVRAESDLRSALSTLDGNLASLNGAITRARFDSGIAEVRAYGSASKISALNERQLLALQEQKTASDNSDLALASAISRNSVLRNGYLGLLGAGAQGGRIDIVA